jgi:hypothetical protein
MTKKKINNTVTRKDWKMVIIAWILGIVVNLVFYILNNYDPENKLISELKIDGRFQKKLKETPSVNAFLDYLSLIEKKDTLNSRKYQPQYNNTMENWLYSYFLTKKYEIKYIIPDTEDEDKFYAFLTFEDKVTSKEVNKIKQFQNTPVSEIGQPIINEDIITEVYTFIEKRFIIDSVDNVKGYIKDYMSKMTMKEFVIQDWRFPMEIVSKLHLQSKPHSIIYYDTPQSHTILCKVEMKCVNQQWKCVQFTTIAISRWDN